MGSAARRFKGFISGSTPVDGMKLAVIGAGTIGAGVAYNVAIRDIVDEICLIDLDEETAQGEALDIAHAAALDTATDIRQTGYDAAADADIVAVTAGKPRKEGMTRHDVLEANAGIIDAIHTNTFADDAVFVTTTNPMDVINYLHTVVTDRPRDRFIGFGGVLDSARFRYALADYLDTTPDRINATVIGEHGDAQVPVYSRVTVDGDPVDIPEDDQADITEASRESAMNVISRKGYTQWGPTYGVADMIEAVATDARRTLPCSIRLDGEYGHSDVSLGVPAVIGRGGIHEIAEWELTDVEQEAFDAAADKLADYCSDAADMV